MVGDEVPALFIGRGAAGEGSQEAQGIDIRETLGGGIELFDVRDLDIFGRPQEGFQFRQDVVIEPEIGPGELVFQHAQTW